MKKCRVFTRRTPVESGNLEFCLLWVFIDKKWRPIPSFCLSSPKCPGFGEYAGIFVFLITWLQKRYDFFKNVPSRLKSNADVGFLNIMIFFWKNHIYFSNQVSRKTKTPAYLPNPGHFGELNTKFIELLLWPSQMVL